MTATATAAFAHPPVYSPWFTLATQQPWDLGVYEVDDAGLGAGPWYSCWNGFEFSSLASSPDGAVKYQVFYGRGNLITSWRGIVPPSRLPRFITETWGQACARVPSLSEFADKPVSASHAADVLCLADCMPGYELMQFGGLPGLSFIFRRRDPA